MNSSGMKEKMFTYILLMTVSNQTNVYLVQIHSSLDNITNIT